MSPDTKLIASLVNRILVRLPSNSGKKLEALENDPLVNQTVSALIELSKFRLPTITSTLLQLLDSIKMPPNDEYFPYENLQSQLFVLRMLSACMQHNWQYVKESKRGVQPRRPPIREDYSLEESLALDMEDPPPFEDNVAKTIINSMCRVMHQTTVMEEREYGQTTNHVTQITRLENYTVANISRTSADIVLDIYKASSRVIAYLSASNWNVVFSKIKMRMLYLTITTDENPETSDMRLLECCSLNSKRLSVVLSEFCDNFKDLKKTTQLTVAAILRRAIWGWIETYPGEFMRLCHNKRTLEGGPDLLFDLCMNLADSPRKKAILWPLQIMLLMLCPDVLYAYVKHDNRTANAKKIMFLSSLKSSLKPGRMAELAAICYIDICKAATYVSKADTSALRHIVPDIENELRGQLFDVEKPLITDNVMSGLGLIIDHRALLADCLVAMFRLNPRHALRSLFPSCLEYRSPTLFKISLVKACLCIASEENRLPWNPSVIALYDTLCGPLRKLFIEFTNKDFPKIDISSSMNLPSVSSRKMMMPGNTTDKKSRKDVRVDQNIDKWELVLDMLRLYQADPKLAIKGGGDDGLEMNAITMVAITNCLKAPNQYVRDAAATCLYQLHSADYIMEWTPSSNFMESFWIISSQVIFALAKQLLDNRERDDGIKRLLELLKKLFESRNEFLRSHQDVAMQGSETRERLQASIGVEVALLVLLCSSDIEICTSAIACFGHICNESNITESVDDPHQSILMVVENLPIYAELSSNNGLVTGRKSQQKQIRRLLRMMTHYAPGNLAAWEEVYKRWKYMTPNMMKPHDETKDDLSENNNVSNTLNVNPNASTNLNSKRPSPAWHDKFRNTNSSNRQTSAIITYPKGDLHNLEDDKSPEWQNYAGFLAALGGICLMADATPTTPSSPITPKAGYHDPSFRRNSTPNESSAMVNRFVIDMVDLLLCDNVIIREWVKEILGSDLSPALYPMLFRYMETVLSKHFESDGDPICNVRNTLFVEQAISVLKLVLDRMEGSVENLLTVDFSSLINQYARYLNKLGNDQSALKIKIKFCQLTKVLMSKKDKVTLRQEFKLRNKLLEIIVEWTSDFSLKPESTSQFSSFEVSQSEKLHRELDLACLSTIVGLLHQLPLQSSDPVHESDSTSLKSKIFYNYFTFFLKLLNRCRDSENETDTVVVNRSYLDSMSKTKENVNTYLAPLKESTILAMSNLLSANVDAGLKYCLSMGYHDDPQMRTAFMKVLTNILNQGTEFETLAETVMIDRYEKLVNMLVGMDLQLALSLCEICSAADVEDVAHALLAGFASRGKSLVLLKAVIQKEVQNTDNETELLRRTSIATRLLALYAKQNGADYVRSVLQPVFQQLADMPAEEKTFELDTSKVSTGEDVSRNKKNVERATELFLNGICASAHEAPKAFRELCHCILTSVRERYPEAKYTAVGAFIFLRFFCPAIVAPEAEGLIKPNTAINRDMKRGYLIVTKVIQNLANNVLFGAKEAYMIMLNDFLTSNIYKVTSFLRDISEISTSMPPEEESEQEIRPMEEKDYACMHRVLFDNMERLSRELATRRLKQTMDPEIAALWKRQYDKFSNLMAQLGRPPEVTKQEFISLRSYTFAAANQLYAEFMRRNSHRSVESIISKNIFYEGGVSKSNRPVFYFIARNVISDNIDYELLVYLMLQIMERASNKSFEVVMDMTMFSSENEIPIQWLTQMIQLLPFESTDNVANILIYNPNSHLQKYLKKLPRPMTHKFSKRLNFAVTLAEIYEHINPNEVRLPKSTTSLDTEQCTVFHPVNRLLPYKITIAITVRISSEHVQFMTVRKQDFFYGISTIINDVFMITDIEDIINIPNTRNQEAINEFQFKHNKDKTQHLFSSVKRDIITNHIRHNKRRLEMAKPSSISERNIRPNDVPGRLLNMALLNIGSDEPSLRLAAYNLLYALSVTFHFDVGNQLLDARDLCLPANSTAFIVNISEKIAQNQHNLTLEFLRECFTGFQKSSEPLRYLCLDYMMPWLTNLSRYCHNSENDRDTIRTKEVLRNLIDLTVARTDMYKLVQAKIWKTIGQVDDILNMVLDSFVQFSIEHGVGSPQAEAMADTFVTLSNISVRGKVVSRLRKVLQKTSFKPTRSLTEHWTWKEIAILIRFILMLSFNNRGPVKSYVPEIMHIVTIVVGVGPTIVKASVYGLVINILQSLCTTMPIPEANVKKLQLILTEMSDTKYRLMFGLTKPYTNAFTIMPDTMNDQSEPISLQSLETIVIDLMEALSYCAPSMDMANAWRARWMSLVASTTFQFNPAIQPQSFVVLGCLGREDVDDDLLYQILVALRGALVIFNEGDCNLVLSIMMCLKNIVSSLPPDSRYLLNLFWIAIALVQMNNGTIYCMAIELVLSVLRALETHGYFAGDRVSDVLLAAREPMADTCAKLDELCGVKFGNHFSFAIACIFLKGIKYTHAKDLIFSGLTTFLDIDCKHSEESDLIESQHLGYLAGLLPIAVKTEALRDVLRIAGLNTSEFDLMEGINDDDLVNYKAIYDGIFERLDISDETTGLLFISTLVTQLQSAEHANEKLFIYGLLAEAAMSMPEVFAVIYDSLLPKMNYIVLNSNNQLIIESVKSILLIACSDAAFGESNKKSQLGHKAMLENAGFSALGDPTFNATSANIMESAKLTSDIIDLIIA